MQAARFRTYLLATAAGALLAGVSTGGAFAADAAAADNATTGTQVGEVVVTAQKRSERQLDVPAAITVLDGDRLLENHFVSISDYFKSVPGLTLYDNGQGFKQLVVRGITTGNGSTPTVGIYIDETPIGSSTALARGDVLVPDIDPSDLQQIEVLKGPQGTLYGASNMGGLLKYVTVLPNLNTYSGHIEADGSTVEHGGQGWGVRAAVNIPIVQDKLAVRLSASDREDPGFIDNVLTGQSDVNKTKVYNFRASALWQITPDLRLRLSAQVQDHHSFGSGREDYDYNTNQPFFGDLQQARVPGTDVDRERVDIFNGTVDWNFGPATLTSSTSYAINRYKNYADLSPLFGPLFGPIFGIPDYGVTLTQDFGTKKFTQEVRLASNGGPGTKLDWIGGLFYTREHAQFYQHFDSVIQATGDIIPGLPILATSNGPSVYSEVAGFGDVTYHFNEKFDVQGGLRYSYNDQRAYNDSVGILGAGGHTFGSSHEGVATFLVTPEYKFNDQQMIYGRVASGYRAGGPNITLEGNTAPYGSDTTINYEVGFKSTFLDRRAYVDFDVFYITWKKIQLLAVNDLHEEVITNAGDAVSKGFEFSGQLRPVTGLNLAANLTYSDAHLTDPAPAGIAANAGARLPYSPRWAGQVSANYDFPLAGQWLGSVGGDISYIGDRRSDYQNSFSKPWIDLPAYTTVDLRAGVKFDRYSFDLFAHNVADKRGFNAANPSTLSDFGRYGVSVIQPRTLGVEVAASF